MVLLALPGPAGAQSRQEGQKLFEERCAGCHTIGRGALVGPDLAGVTARLGADEVRRFVLAPGEARPGTAMPDLGLSEEQVAALVAYLDASAGAEETVPDGPQGEPAPAAAPAGGDVELGKSLFTGAERFENGGPPCLSCHSIAGIGSLGGGALGPDLTAAYARYGTGLDAVLETIAFPTMQPVYGGQPLTAGERQSLVAFIAEAEAASRPGSAVWKLFLLGLGGAAALVAAGLAVWRRRLPGVRRPLVARANSRRR